MSVGFHVEVAFAHIPPTCKSNLYFLTLDNLFRIVPFSKSPNHNVSLQGGDARRFVRTDMGKRPYLRVTKTNVFTAYYLKVGLASQLQIQIKQKSQFEFVPRDTSELPRGSRQNFDFLHRRKS